jgi:hypothetical protein
MPKTGLHESALKANQTRSLGSHSTPQIGPPAPAIGVPLWDQKIRCKQASQGIRNARSGGLLPAEKASKPSPYSVFLNWAQNSSSFSSFREGVQTGALIQTGSAFTLSHPGIDSQAKKDAQHRN